MMEMTGRTIGNYRVVDKLGEGGMGQVYRAIDTMVQREVALKFLRPEIAAQPGVLDRFRSEAVTLARLNHPAIAHLYTFFKDGDDFYMVMEFVPGETLEAVIRREGAMPWVRALGLVRQILEGIGHAHDLGILHRDLKPANIMLTPSGQPKLMDFGIAQALGGARLTRDGRLIGTLEYLAPERVQGKPASVRSDLYSVGVLLYEMLTGRLPFESDSDYELLLAHVQKNPPVPRELGIALPPAVEAAVMKALSKDPEARYGSAAEFAAQLAALSPAAPTATVSVPPAVKRAGAGPAARLMALLPAHNRNLWAAIFAATALLAIITAVSAGWSMLRPARPAIKIVQADSGPAPAPEAPAPIVPSVTIPYQPVAVPAEPSVPAPEPIPPVPGKKVAPPQPTETPAPPAKPVEEAPKPEPTPPPPPPDPEPAPAPPAAAAPRRSLTLRDVRSLYIARADEDLDQYIRDEIRKQLGARLRLAESPAAADAVMTVQVEAQKGGTVSRASRVLGFGNKSEVHAEIAQAGSTHVLWRQGAGDHKPIVGAFHGASVKRLAERIVKELADDLR